MTNHNNGRPYMAVHQYIVRYNLLRDTISRNIDGVEFTVIKVAPKQELTIIGVYRSPRIPVACALIDIIIWQASIPGGI